jgi:uncharacterized damage-inducible protein DinB
MTEQQQPSLQQPGAGLPLPELYIAKFRFWQFRRRNTVGSLKAMFEQEQSTIQKLLEAITPSDGAKQVLIRRLRGMEDSSRNWSVYMTLNHLSIVNGGVAKSIRTLLREETPSGRVGTADVKPEPDSDASSVDTFNRVCSTYLKTIKGGGDLKTRATHNHPWFGPLNAYSWHALVAFHMRLHRRQIELIAEQV